MSYLKRAYFRDYARPVQLNIAGLACEGTPKEFSSGSFGWHFGGKATVMVGGQPVLCRVNVLVTVDGGKKIN